MHYPSPTGFLGIIVLCNPMIQDPDSKRTGNRFLAITLPLILINATVANLLTNQVVSVAYADRIALVKDDSAIIAEATDATTEEVSETAIGNDSQPVITTYIVKSGDTLSGIAEKFGISVNTIRWANDLTAKTSKIQIGDELTILPVTGVEYTVKKGDTLSGIAHKYNVSQDDILAYNDIDADAIKVGTKLILPNAEPITPKTVSAPKKVTTPTAPATKTTSPDTGDDSDNTPTTSGYTVPVHGILTQGIHDVNAVDFGVPAGTSVVAFKSGTVIVAKSSGYNGGYGNFIVINHEGACQTQYSHLSSIKVSVGDTVSAGDLIALSGNTGRSTGPHLHFNVRNCGGNPFAKFKKGTQF